MEQKRLKDLVVQDQQGSSLDFALRVLGSHGVGGHDPSNL